MNPQPNHRFLDALPTMNPVVPDESGAKFLPGVISFVQDVCSAAKKVPVIAADNVARFLSESGREEWRFDTDFPSAIPPFEKLFVEWRRPPWRCISGGTRESTAKALPLYAGSWVIRRKRADVDAAEPDEGGNVMSWVDGELRKSPRWPDAEWVVTYYLIHTEPTGRAVFCAGLVSVMLDKLGRVLAPPNACPFAPIPDKYESLNYALSHTFAVSLLTMGFMNAKGAETQVVTRGREERKKIERQSGSVPITSYRVINVNGGRLAQRRDAGKPTTGETTAPLAIVRGHLAHYTADAPLFGRPDGVGVFWKPDHFRGNERNGVRLHDYRIAPMGAKK